MRRLITTIGLAASILMLAPHAAGAANLQSKIIPTCDQTLYTIQNLSSGETKDVFPEDYGPGKANDSNTYKVVNYGTTNACTLNDLLQVFVNLFSWGLYIISVLALFFFFLGGGVLLLSGGSPERLKTGKAILVNTVIGLVIALGSWVIVNLVVVALNPDKSKNGIGILAENQPWFRTSASGALLQCTDPPEFPCKDGEQVKDVQRKMLDGNCYDSPNASYVDGVFDERTLTAWNYWQKLNNASITTTLSGYDSFFPCAVNTDTNV